MEKILLCVVMIVSIWSCKKDNAPSLVGTWEVYKLETSRKDGGMLIDHRGEEVKVKIEEWSGISEFNADGTFINGQSSGTYTINGSTVDMKYNGSSQIAYWRIFGNELTLSYDTGEFIMVFYLNKIN